jgi:predicted DNA-binding protein (MmcQ/YjbR family)
MNLDKIREYCLKKRGTEECMPFGEDTLVFKVLDKMFCLARLDPPFFINLKCDPEYAVELRDRYDGVIPGYHMSKRHWNTIELDSNIPEGEILEWIDHSYDLVVKSLSQKKQSALKKQ